MNRTSENRELEWRIVPKQNPPKSQTRTFRVISFLPVGAKRLIPLFALSSSIAQLLCQNKIAQKGKPGLSGQFLIWLPELNEQFRFSHCPAPPPSPSVRTKSPKKSNPDFSGDFFSACQA
ncbi:hypothetical protein [Metabacillus sp. SLBN-84]